MIIAIANQKGGGGKSTIAINLALYFERKLKFKVLVVDGDPQKTISSFFLSDQCKSKVEIVQAASEHLAKIALQHAPKYDITLIDCQGAICPATKSAMLAADFVLTPLIPSEPDVLSTSQFISQVIDEAIILKTSLKGAFILNQDGKTVISKAMKNLISEIDFPIFETSLPYATAYKDAYTKRKAVFDYEPKGKAATSFIKFCKEISKEVCPNV